MEEMGSVVDSLPMSDFTHKDYKFSIVIHSDDLALVSCFRALCQYCQDGGNGRISWAGTGKKEWRREGHRVKFHFKSSEERDEFVCQAKRLFPKELWSKGQEKDNDPRAEE